MAKLTTVEKLIDLAGEMNVSEIMNYEQGIKLLKAIKDNGIEISEDELLLEVAQKLSRNIGAGMKLLLKLDEEIIAGLIEAIANNNNNNNKGEDVKMANRGEKMNTVNNNTNGANNTIVGGTDMNRVKVEGFKMAGLDGMLKMGAFNPALFSDKEFLTAMEELKAEAKESKTEETVKEVKDETNNIINEGKNMVTMENLNELAGILTEEQITLAGLVEDYPKAITVVNAFKNSGVRVIRKSQLNNLITKATEKGIMEEILAKVNCDDFMEVLEEVKYDYTEVNADKEEKTVMSQKTEEKSSDNNIKGGNTMKKETKTTNKQTEGGNTMEDYGLFGVKHELNILNTEEYLGVFTTIATEFGKEGLAAIDKLGTKVAVVSYKERRTLKDLFYRGLVLATVEWIKAEFDNDFIEFIGSSIQGYQIIRVGMDVYRLYKSFNSVTRKDIDDLNTLLEKMYSERRARERKDNAHRGTALDE